MPPTVQVGSILIEGWSPMTQLLGVETQPYSGNWSLVKALGGFALDRKIHAAGLIRRSPEKGGQPFGAGMG